MFIQWLAQDMMTLPPYLTTASVSGYQVLSDSNAERMCQNANLSQMYMINFTNLNTNYIRIKLSEFYRDSITTSIGIVSLPFLMAINV